MENIAAKPTDDKTLSISRNSTEEIRLSIRSYNGHPFIDIRQYFQSDEGGWLPTKRGVTIPPRLWHVFRAALSQLEGELERRGLLASEGEEG